MFTTPELVVDDDLLLKPANRNVLFALFDAYQEDSAAAHTALPWLNSQDDIRRQLRDMLYDVEAQKGTDRLHFWSIHQKTSEEFVGLVGLGDELQALHSDFNLGYWVRHQYQRQRIASRSVDAIFSWLKQRDEMTVVEIAVHPKNIAGLATATAICGKWHGKRLEEFIGITINNKTVAHHLHLVEIGSGV